MTTTTQTPAPDASARVLAVLRDDAASGAATVLEGAEELRCILRMLERQIGNSPVKDNAHLSLAQHLSAALVLAWDALAAVEAGAQQARTCLARHDAGAQP